MSAPKVPEFHGKHRFLSNFWSQPLSFEGTTYESAEHAFHSQKTSNTKERDYINYDRSITTFEGVKQAHCRETFPYEAKQRGRKVTLRPDWEENKLDIMYAILTAKFGDPVLRALLISTGDAELIEGNVHHDDFWGVCNCDRHKGTGDNHLGKLLMKLRDSWK